MYSSSFPRYDLCSFLAINIKEKLDDFPIVAFCKYPSCLFYFFIHQNCEYFKGLNLKMFDEQGNPIPVLKWHELCLRRNNNTNFIEFTNKVMKIAYTIIHVVDPPLMFPENQILPQFTPQTATGDWFLFQWYALFRVYGFE